MHEGALWGCVPDSSHAIRRVESISVHLINWLAEFDIEEFVNIEPQFALATVQQTMIDYPQPNLGPYQQQEVLKLLKHFLDHNYFVTPAS